MAIAIVFGLQWFRSDGSLNQAGVRNWPPVINMCPDFLSLTTLHLPKSANDDTITPTHVCIDTVGVSNNNVLNVNTGDLTGNNTYFPLFLDATDNATRSKNLCDKCREMGLTWDGIFDGASCLNGIAPNPAASVRTNAM